jgi:hypothetical protein
MTEAEWRTTTDVEAMLDYLSQRVRRRRRGGPGLDYERFRTFAAACARQTWPHLSDPLREAVNSLERLPARTHRRELDRLRGIWDVELGALCSAVLALRSERPGNVCELAALRLRQSAASIFEFATRTDPYRAAQVVAVQVIKTLQAAERLQEFPADESIATYGSVQGGGSNPATNWKVGTDLLRCIFGSPFRPVAFDPAWRTEAVVALARGIDERRDFAALPVLADALEDAGCADAELLAHCRGPGPHARGCHAVDHVLGRWERMPLEPGA